MATGIPVFPNFSVHEPAVDTRWNKWCNRLDNLLVGLDIKDKKRKRALLLHYAGEEVNDVFDTLSDTGDDYDTAVQKLTEYFSPRKCTEYEVFKFHQAKQEHNETIDTFQTRLRKLSQNCDFADKDKEIKSQIVQGCLSSRLRRTALRQDISLDDLIKEARALELSEKHASEIESGAVNETNAVRHRHSHPKQKQHKSTTTYRQDVKRKQHNQKKKCRNCGYDFPHKPETKCPAEGKTCNYCNKRNHFEAVCRSKVKQPKYVRTVEDSDSDSDISSNYTFGLLCNKADEHVNSVHPSQPKINIKLNGYLMKILIDTGSSVNVIDENTYLQIKDKPKLTKTDTKIYAYGSTSVKILGKMQATFETNERITTAPVYVTQGKSGNLLSYNTSVDLQVIPRINSLQGDKVNDLCQKCTSVFTGLGKLRDTQIDLHIDPNIQPVSQPHRRIPFHLRTQVEIELKRLEDLDIIEKVDGPTDWVSPIVVAPKPKSKNNEIRICVDMRQPNQAIKRTRHIIPTIDDMIVDLNGAKFFSKLDLNKGYHQLELSEKSRNITTFTTHVGLRRYKRLSFGINSAAEIFQNTLRTALEGLEGVRNISDDIIVYGNTQEDHDKRLEATLKRLQEKRLTLNKSKCEFNQRQLEFFGYVFGEEGLSADPKKCETIKNTQPPTNVSEIRSFLAMTNYVSRFIPNYSTTTEPLRQLTKKNVKWHWDKEQQTSFDKLKAELSSKTVMSYFDPNKETQVIVDASPVGVAGIMLQEGKVICYASKSLTDVEKRYSQTERENLAIVWAIEHWHIYLFGHPFVLVTDAKALENIYSNPKSKPPARLERWRLRLQAYDFKVVYKPGQSNMSDYLSRHPDSSQNKTSRQYGLAEEYLTFITQHDVPKAMTLDEIVKETTKDNCLQTVIQNVKRDSWDKSYSNKTLDTFSRCKNELTVVSLENGEVLLHDTKLVIPAKLQNKVIAIAHEGHQGIVRTKQLLREKVYFPGIDKLVEEVCKSCIPCLASINKNVPEPLKMSKMPDYAFQEVSMDFCGPFPDGKYLLVLIDDYSRFPFVEILNSLSSKTVIPSLDKLFSIFGIPQTLKTDNGPPMNGNEFKLFMESMGIKHRKVTPLWPIANGECERFMRTLGKTIRASHTYNTSWKQDMYSFLRNYRATPHATTKHTPAELFFGRKIQTKLPQSPIKTKDQKKIHKQAKMEDKQQKNKIKTYADKRRRAQQSNLKVGDKVLVRQEKRNKFTSPFDPKPFKIIKKKGSMITAQRGDRQITRNSSYFKLVRHPSQLSETDETE